MSFISPKSNEPRQTQARPDYYVAGWDLTWMLCHLEPAMWLSHDGMTLEACRQHLINVAGFDENEIGDGSVTEVDQEHVFDVHIPVNGSLIWMRFERDDVELCAWYGLFEHFVKCVDAVVASMVARADEDVLVGIDEGPRATTMGIKVVNRSGDVWSLNEVRRTIPDIVAAISANPRVEEQ